MRTPASLALFLAVLSLAAFAENWPQWRGPTLNGISTEKIFRRRDGVAGIRGRVPIELLVAGAAAG
jgi:hypothetical protein